MALLNVIKYAAESDEVLAWRYPSDKITLGSQLIVGEGQIAIFVKGGQALDEFRAGTYTLSTGNIPLLQSIANLPFGGKTPFSAEVWFLNTTTKRNLTWGTSTPIPVMDKSLGFPVSIRAYGTWGVQISEIRPFLTQILGSRVGATSEIVDGYFIGKIVQSISEAVAKLLNLEGSSIFDVATQLSRLSSEATTAAAKELALYGLRLTNLDVQSVNIPDEERQKIQAVFEKTLEVRELSKTAPNAAYSAVKSFEVLNKAASNEGAGSIAPMLAAGIGLGVGLPVGQQMGQALVVAPAENPTTRKRERLRELKELYDDGLIPEDRYQAELTRILES
jgi:membrane protease subunit (stomatin/prohibitin family)